MLQTATSQVLITSVRIGLLSCICLLTPGLSAQETAPAATDPSVQQWAGKWIALPDIEDDINLWFLARREFEVSDSVRHATIAITADTTYQLFINGRFVADGPVRAFPEHYRYDAFDIADFVQPGENVIGVKVHHWGRDTAKNIAVAPGLLAQCEWADSAGSHVLGTDRTWYVAVDPARDPRSPIVSSHLGFEEHYDARRAHDSWMSPSFPPEGWSEAEEVATVADGPWRDLRLREIPPLVKETVEPAGVLGMRHVRAPRIVSTLNLGRCQGIARKENNVTQFRFLLATSIHSDQSQQATVFRPSNWFEFAKLRFSDREIDTQADLLQQLEASVKLQRGDNPLIVMLDGRAQSEEFQFAVDAESSISLSNPLGEGEWAIAGPFTPKDPVWQQLRKVMTLEELKPFLKSFRDAEPMEIISSDVHGQTCHRRVVGAGNVTSANAFLRDDDQWTLLPGGEDDVEFMIDFGKECNIHVGFEIDAPEGVILDGVIFERFHDGEPQWPWRVRSSFRYVTRAGVQSYETANHFGGRYLALTVRGRSDPVRIRRVYGKFMHYPVVDRGRFHCSDEQLNAVWDISRQTMLACMEDTFVDCPLYEQSLWLGDARNEALVCAMMFGDWRLVRRCCTLGCESVEQNKGIAAMRVPTRWGKIIPAWNFLWARMCWENYWYSGDERLLVNRYYPAVRTMLDTCLDEYIDPGTGLFSIQAWQFIDWTELDNGHKIVTHNNTFLVDTLRLGARMARIARDRDGAVRFQKASDDLAARINEHLWSEDRSAYIDSVHNDGQPSTSISRQINTLALLHGVVPKEREANVLAVAMDGSNDVVQFGSPFTTLYLLELLGERGESGQMLDVIRSLWGTMMDEQTTTFWESFATGNLGGARYPTRSYCHAWSAGPAYALSRYVLGARLEEPGGARVSLTPQIDVLEQAEGVIPLPSGTIKLSWQRESDDVAKIAVSVEGDVQTTLLTPHGWSFASKPDSDDITLGDGGTCQLRAIRN
ncbi:MAG: alpha-L-rhamnosidase N-terminal domain-containing protein [Planctomycetes bacterium]|nr:alpha-L-rhamnosidase N-terminal domain-containing protein [Planctomycetota bacterium]